ncbi:type III polyketide synthase [Microbacterium sp. ProA8]|uniref:type III polyketide synthase n=1 Tax=Microbacterium chionoecetis TaxID=3153754 RepID=UPI00326540BC
MTARIVSIGTAVPATRIRQDDVRALFAAQDGVDRLTRRRIQAVFDASAIEQRHTVLTDLATPPGPRPAGVPAFVDAEGRLLSPTTGTRNDLYIATAPALSAEAARAALRDGRIEPSAVTHVVTVSCTGLFAPGPDYRLVRDLGLSPTVERCHLGFIGCAAALPALRVATALAATRPDAVVLMVCTELCSLHVRASADPQQIVAASVFADGAAAAIVTADPAIGRAGGLDLERFGTALTDEGETDMVWTIGDNGFEMVLSAEVPRIIGREIQGAVARFLGDDGDPAVWAVHPGGRSVLDRVETGLELAPDALAASRGVLRDYGNMSSATILFILAALLRDEAVGDGARVAGLAFGPGLTVESALMTKRRVAEAVDDDMALALAASA